jgi:hypothetical protein
VWAGVVADADATGGRYCENCEVAEVTTDPASSTGVFGYALDGERARALWALSERLVGEHFGWRHFCGGTAARSVPLADG